MQNEEARTYEVALKQYLAKAESLGLSLPEADKVLARVISEGYATPQGTEEFEEAQRRLQLIHAVDNWPKSPKPGEIVLLRIEGIVGLLVWTMQALNGDLSKWTHVGVMLDDRTFFEAQPGGAVITPWSKYEGRPHAIVRYAMEGRYRVPLDLSLWERERIVEAARARVGRGYNWSTYFYLAAYRLRIRPQWLKDRVQRSDKFICSQAADDIYGVSGIHLFDDGRMPFDLTPGDFTELT